jgi:hypothetical protein
MGGRRQRRYEPDRNNDQQMDEVNSWHAQE